MFAALNAASFKDAAFVCDHDFDATVHGASFRAGVVAHWVSFAVPFGDDACGVDSTEYQSVAN